jgi:hypothetical protein
MRAVRGKAYLLKAHGRNQGLVAGDRLKVVMGRAFWTAAKSMCQYKRCENTTSAIYAIYIETKVILGEL